MIPKEDLLKTMDDLGIVKFLNSGIKSIKVSLKTGLSIGTMKLTSNVITEISPESKIDIENVFAMGFKNFAPSHPNLGKSKLTITKNATFTIKGERASVGPCSVVFIDGDYKMGEYSYINSHCRIICYNKIEIGSNCSIAWNVEMLDDDRHQIREKKQSSPIIIGDNVWIGNNVGIKKGVKIGDGAVISSFSTVTKDVPSNCLVGGVPAEIIERDVEWA